MNKINFTKYIIPVFTALFVFLAFGFTGDDIKGTKKNRNTLSKPTDITTGGKYGDSYRLFVNNINLPLNRSGIIAAVNITDPDPVINGAGGKYDGNVFLFSSGFFLSGYANGNLWANAVASASLVEDYVPGTVEKGSADPNAVMYVLKATDPPFGSAWQVWKDAVDLGAEFYDGDGDGVYNPADKNNNGVWDRDEDSPDLLGDETVWCVYNDGVPGPQRRWNTVDPLGIEIRQTVFALISKGAVGNMIFVRYKFKYVGLGNPNEPEKLDDVYFGVWADPDLGEPADDLVGSDVSRNAGYTYMNAADPIYGENPPAFVIDFFQGPQEYIPGVTFEDANGNGVYDSGETALDTAYSVRGRRMNPEGPVPIPGAKNQPLSSFVLYINGDPSLRDPDNVEEARNYILGKDRTGIAPDPCSFSYGSVVGGVDCSTIDPRFWFSGDPVAPATGWLNTQAEDVRQMSNTGPFTLVKDEEKEIVVAYVVGRGEDGLSSITNAREIDDLAQEIFNNNFPSPPPPPPIEYTVRTGSDYIDISFNTADNINYIAIDSVLDIERRVQGFYINQFKTNSKAGSIQGIKNLERLATYGLDNGIDAIYRTSSNGGEDIVMKNPEFKREFDQLADSTTGRVVLRLREDIFEDGPFIKGKEYYFAITQFTLNHKGIVNRATGTYGPEGDYLDRTGSGLEEFETAIIKVTFGADLYDPSVDNGSGSQQTGASSGAISYLTVNRDQLTGQTYAVEFFSDKQAASTSLYTPYWRLKNESTGAVLIDSSKVYEYDTLNYAGKVVDGFLLKVKPSAPTITTTGSYEPAENEWYSTLLNTEGTGVFYVGQDISQGAGNVVLGSARSTIVRADRLRRVEIRFQEGSGKAYRYLNGYIGTSFLQTNTSYRFAEGISATDTVGKGPIGKFGEGFVDVPFTAWVVDERYDEEKQLAVGFMERRGTGNNYFGSPDGLWDPGDTLRFTREAIIIFDAPYDPTGSQIEYTGGEFTTNSGTTTVWADPVRGFTIPADAQGITEEQKKIAKSPLFNTLYVVGLDKENGSFYNNGDKFIASLTNYPYTDIDKFTFNTANGDLSFDEKRELFEKVNVFPNPLYGYNVATSYTNSAPDEPFVTFSNLPDDEVTIKIFTLSGNLIRTLVKETGSGSPFLGWDLLNESGLRAASGLYLAIVSSKNYGEKVLKFSIIMPQKQLPRF